MTFSETDDAEETTAYCDPSIIPIFPLRFALKGDALIGMLNSTSTPSTPTSLTGSSHHELLRIRQGYVYVYDGSVLQVFRFQTRPNDENGSIYRGDTELQSQSSAYTFTKYNWDSGNSRGDWTLLNESYPYVFVPKDTPTAWIAYSENRWPYRFFYEAETNGGFRNSVMTEVDLAGRSGDYCAPITELATHVKTFTDDSVEYTAADYTLENAIRHTSVEIEPVRKVVTCDNTREKGVLVGLHDPVGEIQDLLGLMSVHSMTLANYLSEHQYPMTIGKAVKNYRDADEVSTTRLRFWTGPLSEQFDAKYASLNAEADAIQARQAGLARHWINLAKQDGFGSLGGMFAACDTISDRYSLGAHPLDHTENIGFRLLIMARMMTASATSQNMSVALAPLFTGIPSLSTPSGWDKVQPYFDNGLKLTMAAITGAAKHHDQFKPALSAVFTVYGTEIVQAGISNTPNTTGTLLAVMYTESVQFHSRNDLSRAFTELMEADGYDATPFPSRVNTQQLGTNITASSLMTEAAEGRVGVVEFHAQIDITVDQDYLNFARRANNFDLAVNGFGIVAAGLSLHGTIAKWDDPVRSASAIGGFAQNPTTQLIAGFADAYAGTYEVGKALAGRSSTAATNAVLRSVFQNNVSLVESVAANGVVASRGAIAMKSLAVSAKIAGAVGVVMNGFMAVEGYNRGDSFMAAGNGLMALGGIVLLLGAAGPLALIAVAAIVIGIIVAAFSYNDAQRWVKDGFWGTSGDYWGADRPDLLSTQIARAKEIAHPNMRGYARVNEYFEAELEQYLDMNSSLTLEDLQSNDGSVEITCSVLQTAADLSRVSVTSYIDWTFPYNNVTVSNRVVFVAPGKARVILTKPSSLNETGPVQIEVAVSRRPNGEFEADITVESNQLW